MSTVLTYVCAKGHRGLKPACFCGLRAELENLNKPAALGSTPSLAKASADAPTVRSKYGSKAVVIDGIEFDSTAEGAYYLYLRMREDAGEIFDLATQHPIAIRGENKARIGLYNADFFFRVPGKARAVIVDVKGRETAVFRLKQKMLEAQGVTIQLVTASEIPAEFLALAREIRDSGIEYSTRNR